MKRPLLLLLTLALAAPLLRADEVALVSLRIAKEKQRRDFAIEFYENDAPLAVANFKKLARKGFYKGVAVHRAFPHLLVQVGDPLSKRRDRSNVGTGGPGYTIPPEIRRKHSKGAIAAARLPDKINPSRLSNGSQFYVCLEPMPNLDGQYTVFAHTIWGLDTLDLISTKSVDSNDNPIERIQIRSVKIMERDRLPGQPSAAPGPAPAKPAKKPWWRIFG